MASKKTPPAPKPKTALIIPLDDARERISKRLDKGNEILQMEIRNEEDLRQVKAEHRKWSDYTTTLLEQMFNTDEIAHGFAGYGGWATVLGEIPFHKEKTLFRDRVRRDIERLTSIYERLEVYPVILGEAHPDEDATRRAQDTPSSVGVTFNIDKMIGSQIQQGTYQSTQVATFSQGDLHTIAEFIQTLKGRLPELQVEHAKKEEIEAEIASVEVQLNSPRPKPAIIKECLASLRTILEGMAGNVIATLLLQQLTNISIL